MKWETTSQRKVKRWCGVKNLQGTVTLWKGKWQKWQISESLRTKRLKNWIERTCLFPLRYRSRSFAQNPLILPWREKRGNPCPRLLLTKNRCFLTEVKVRRKVSVLELAAHGSNLITQVPWGLFFNIKRTSLCLIMISWAIMSKIKSTHSTQIQTHIHETHSHTCARTQTHSYWDISQLVATCHVTLRESLPPLSFTSFCFIPFHFPLPSASFKRMRESIQNICFHHW